MNENTLRYNFKKIKDRQVDELIGIAGALTADGKINKEEFEFLRNWLIKNRELTDNVIISNLSYQIERYLEDGNFDQDESIELFETLSNFSGNKSEIGELQKSSNSFLDIPEQEVIFYNNQFCFTGTFSFGSRNQCEAVTKENGGLIGSLNRKLNYLVVGTYATSDWMHSTFGRKIEKAFDLRRHGIPIKIVSERNWSKNLQKT